MKLELVEKKHKVEDGKEYTAEYYTLGGYEVDYYTTTYTDGTAWDYVLTNIKCNTGVTE